MRSATVLIGREAELRSGIALLPCNRFEEPYMQEVLARVRVECLIDAEPFQREIKSNRHRVAFISSADGQPVAQNPFASMLLGFGVDMGRFVEAFSPLGLVREVRSLRRRAS